MHGRRLVVRPLAVEDVRGSPRAVEAQVGHGQARGPVLAREGHGAVDEGALRGVLRGKGRELGLGGHGDGDGGGRLSGDRDLLGVPGLGNAVTGEGQRDTRARPVLRVLEEEALLDHLGERLAAEGVGVGSVGEVGQLHLEGPALRPVAEVGLGSGGIGGADDGRVDGRGGRCERVDSPRADPARRVVGAVAQLNVDERVGGAHEEVGNDRVLLLGAHCGEGGIARKALTHEGTDARDLRGGHRGARQALVLVAEVSRHDVAAGGSDLRLEGQVGGYAPRRELRGRRVVRGQHDAGVRDGHGDVGSVGGGQSLADRLAVTLGDGHRRHRRGRAEDRLVGRADLVRVSDHEGRGCRRESRQVARLELLGHRRAVAGVRTALVLEDDHA